MEEISIPEYIDSPPQFLFWELDDLFPILVGAIFGAILKYAFQSVLWFVLGIVVGGIASYFYIKFKRNRLPGTLHHMLFCFTGVVPLNSNYKNGFIQRVNE